MRLRKVQCCHPSVQTVHNSTVMGMQTGDLWCQRGSTVVRATWNGRIQNTRSERKITTSPEEEEAEERRRGAS